MTGGQADGAAPAHTGSQIRAALTDLLNGLANWPQWLTLAHGDVLLRFRRSVLGPLWITLSFAVTTLILGAVYARLLGRDPQEYLPYLAAGLMLWNFAATALQEGCDAFILEAGNLIQVHMFKSTCIYRLLWRNSLILCLNFLVFAGVMAWAGRWPGASLLWLPPGLLLFYCNIAWAVLLLALVCTRFRDIPRLVATLMQLGLLVTPILWDVRAVPRLAAATRFNPLFHLVELVRAPLLGYAPGTASWIFATALAAAGWLVSFFLFARYRWRITYWL